VGSGRSIDNEQEKLMLTSRQLATPVAALVAVLSLTIAPADSASAGAVSAPIQRADTALDRASVQIRAHRYAKARASLVTVRRQSTQAQRIATSLIGAPPTDPESDDVPGPPAVMAVLRLEHRISMQVVDLFNGMKRPGVVTELRRTLWKDHRRRNVMLDKVISLPAEGARADYADGMADTLGIYKQEVQQVTTALSTFRLSPAGRDGLRRALVRVRATNTKVNRAFGGGE
jgi:hypothetical protein